MSETPGIDGIQAALAPGSSPAGAARTPEQLRTLAVQFESLLLGQMLREMRHSMFADEDNKADGLGEGPLADALFSELSVALSRAGGFGLGQALIEPLTTQVGLSGSTEIPTAAAAAASAASTAYAAPSVAAMPGRLSSGYGWRKDPIDGKRKFHRGMDLALAEGELVPAARDGEVVFAGGSSGYGLTVVVRHDARTSTRYAHLSELLVKAGDEVTAGQTIAPSGATGRTTGPHLHFELLEEGQPVDPAGR